MDSNNNIKRLPSNSYLENDISKFSIAFDIPEAKTSNILVSGTNKTGKSRLSAGICSILQNIDWKIVAFDNVGIWKQISDIPTFYRVRKARNYDEETKEWYYPYPTESMIFDMSLLIPDLQKSFVNDCLERIWNTQVRMEGKQWTLIVLEEFQLYGRNIRGSVSQNVLRAMSAGRNWKIRTLAISVDLALCDPAFIRLCGQRFYGRLNIEENSKRKFRNYHGLDYTRIATELDLGYFIYMLRDKLKIIHVPLFQPKRLPQPYPVPKIRIQPPKPSLWQRFKELIK